MESNVNNDQKPIDCELAIVGIACRFPGGSVDPESFWNNLEMGNSGVSKIPADRWDAAQFYHPVPGTPGKYYVERAGTLDDVSGFDAGFFGISPREASQMDPQQRLLMELAWEAFENGGIVPQSVAGTQCSVHIGISSADYANLRLNDPASFDGYSMLGSTLSVAANRLSYFFDLRGSSMAVDSACSSALVALNEAVHGILDGRAEMALVGGVNLLLSPHFFVGFSRAGMLSQDGQCRSFAKDAKGYVRAEGGGILLIKPLSKAVRDGNRIHAVIRGCGSNNDGQTQGIAVPSGERQEELLKSIYRRFGINPDELGYLEAHGTGTFVGDPIEADAIGRALGKNRKLPLPIGSVKSNIGHLEPASGIAGIMKAIGMLKRGIVPRSLFSDDLNKEIPFDSLNIRVVRENEPLARNNAPALVGVNSFGFGGTNAHVVLQEFPDEKDKVTNSSRNPSVRLPISARSETALRQMSGRVADFLADSSVSLDDVAYTAAYHRTHHPYRLSVSSGDRESVINALRNFANRQATELIHDGLSIAKNPKIAFVFAGNGAQGTEEGLRQLIQDPVLKEDVERVDEMTRELAGWSFLEQFLRPESEREHSSMTIIQPLCFAIQLGLAKALMEEGLVPDAVMGHSFGELAAACCAGNISMPDALRVILCRTSIQEMTCGKGSMAALSLGEKETMEWIAPYEGAVEIAAVNSPNAVTLTGENRALKDIEQRAFRRGIDYRYLGLEYPFHSRHLDFGEQRMIEELKVLFPSKAKIPFYSSVIGARISSDLVDGSYWWRNMRQPVLFSQAMASLLDDGHAIFVEIGAYPIMQAYMRHSIKASSLPAKPLCVMSRLVPAQVRQRVLETVSRAYAAGAQLDWNIIFQSGGKMTDLPTYSWERTNHWFPVTEEARGSTAFHSEGILLGARFNSDCPVWEKLLDPEVLPMLASHKYRGDVIFPGSGFVELALEAAVSLHPERTPEIRLLRILHPLLFSESKSRKLKSSFDPETGTFRVESKGWIAKEKYLINATCNIVDGSDSRIEPLPPLREVPGRKKVVSSEDHYGIMAKIGMGYDASFLSVRELTICSRYSEATLSDPLEGGYVIHPAVLDGAFQSFGTHLHYDDKEVSLGAVLPVQIEKMLLFQPGVAVTSCRTRLVSRTRKSAVADIDLVSADGGIVCSIRGVRFNRVAEDVPKEAGVYRIDPIPLEFPDNEPVLASLNSVSLEETRMSIPDFNALFLKNGIPSVDKPWADWIRDYPEFVPELIAAGSREHDDISLKQRLQLVLDGKSSEVMDAKIVQLIQDASPKGASRRKIRILSVSLEGNRDLCLDEDFYAVVNVVYPGDSSSEGIVPRIPELIASDETSSGFDLIVLRQPLLLGCPLKTLLNDARDLLFGWGQIVIGSHTPGEWFQKAFGAVFHKTEFEWKEALESACFSGVLQHLSGMITLVTASVTRVATPRQFIAPNGKTRHWLLAAGVEEESEIFAQELALSLIDRGHYVSILTNHGEFAHDELGISFPYQEQEAWTRAFMESGTHGVPKSLVYLNGFEQTKGTIDEIEKQCWPFVTCVKSLSMLQVEVVSEVVLVTAGGVPLPSEKAVHNPQYAPHQAALHGLGRVFRNEHPNISCRLIDLHGGSGEIVRLVPKLSDELLCSHHEDEVILGADRRFGLRVTNQTQGALAPATGQNRMQLVNPGGGIRGLLWRETTRSDPKAGQVEIEVRATGLNFRDVMYSMGALPEEALEHGFAGPSLGMEGAGIVSRLGSAIKHLKLGDRVVFFGSSCFSSHVTTHGSAVVKIPEGISFEEAASLPTTYFTVIHALKHLGRLKKGEKLLIHGAAGGVGLAAIQFAQHQGVEIFATVGSAEKRLLLRLLGVKEDHIYHSRTLSFADEIMAVTHGKGVDVILNSLSGEAVLRGLEILRPMGRFIELGKRDFYENRMIGLRPFRNNISYFGVDADQLMCSDPKLARRTLVLMESMIRNGILRPLPFRSFDGERVQEAFRLMQGGGHIGKIIVTPREFPESRVSASRNPKHILKPDGHYLVLGGTRGLGLATAKKLTDMGARKLILVSRSGSLDPKDPLVISMLERGVELNVKACDLTEPASIINLLNDLGELVDSLSGIIHSAVVYDDVPISDMTHRQFMNVVAVKAGVALDLMNWKFRNKPDFFLSYSSMASLLGNIGQGNYAAANAVLEAVSQAGSNHISSHRCLAWDAIQDRGHFASRDDLQEAYRKTIRSSPLHSREAMDVLESVLSDGESDRNGSTIFVSHSDWNSSYLRKACGVEKHSRFLKVRADVSINSNSRGNFQDLISSMSPDETEKFCIDMISGQVAHILSMSSEKIDPDKPIVGMGMDSLTALELKITIEKEFGFEMPFMTIGSGGTVRQLAKRLVSSLQGSSPQEASEQDAVVKTLYAKHEFGEIPANSRTEGLATR